MDKDGVCIYHGILVMRQKEILPSATTWMHVEGIMLIEIRQTERQTLYGNTYLWNQKKTNSEEQ